MFKVLLLRSQTEMKNMLLEVEELDPCSKVAANLAKLCSSVFWEVEFVSDELGRLAEEASKQSVEAWPALSLHVVTCESREMS